MSDKIVICLEKGGQRDMAEAFARRTGYRIAEKQGDYLTVSDRFRTDLSGRLRKYAPPRHERQTAA